MKTTNICNIKPNETKAWFRSPFMPSGQEMDRANSTAHWACTGQHNGTNNVRCQQKNFLLYTTEVCYLSTTFRCPSDILITSCQLSVNSRQDVIEMSDGHRNVVIRQHASVV